MVQVPDFTDTSCVYFQACGRLLRSATAREEPMISLRSTRAGRSYLRLIAGGSKNHHLHVDIALAKVFPRGERPSANTKTPAILRQLSAHGGQKIDLLLIGRFILNINDTTPDSGLLFTGPRSVVSSINDATVGLVGARLAISNDAHIDMIHWEIIGSEALIDIYGRCKTEVSDDYLVSAFGVIQKAFATYILGEVAHDAPTG